MVQLGRHLWHVPHMHKYSCSHRWLFMLALALGGLAGSGGRAAADADPKVTMELVQLVTPLETYQGIINQMNQQMLASMQQSGAKGMPPDAAAKMGKAVAEVLPYKDLTAWTVEIYSARFTTEEIRQLIAFYKTPVGKKAARMLPEISGEVGKKMGPIMMQRMPAALKKYGLTP